LKVRYMLPRTPAEEDEVQPITLMQIVEEYKKYKEIAQAFGVMEAESRLQFPRIGKEEAPLEEGDLEKLILVFRQLKPQEEKKLVVKRQEVPIERIVDEIKTLLTDHEKIDFLNFLKGKNDVVIAVAYFFGMLEIVKAGLARVEQREAFGDIFIYRSNRVPDRLFLSEQNTMHQETT
jgi:segregation and condensation protein A